MTIPNVLQALKNNCDTTSIRVGFLIIFMGVVVGPLVLFVIGGRNVDTTGQPGLVWFFLAIALLLVVGVGGGFLMFTRESRAGRDISLIPRSLYQGRSRS